MTPPPAVRDDPLWQVGVSLMSGGSLCKVGVVEFPAGINSKLLFVIVTMLNTIHDTLMPAENCTGRSWRRLSKVCIWVAREKGIQPHRDNLMGECKLLREEESF